VLAPLLGGRASAGDAPTALDIVEGDLVPSFIAHGHVESHPIRDLRMHLNHPAFRDQALTFLSRFLGKLLEAELSGGGGFWIESNVHRRNHWKLRSDRARRLSLGLFPEGRKIEGKKINGGFRGVGLRMFLPVIFLPSRRRCTGQREAGEWASKKESDPFLPVSPSSSSL
jgi:hypothetical protein